MLQLIGFLGCVYLLVKGLELYGSKEPSALVGIAGILAIVAAIIFFFLFLLQGSAMPSPSF